MRLIVIGGGAAGFFCAITAARLNPEARVVILEKSGKLLSKVRISGGGRCNVTHACFSIPEMVKQYPRGERFLKKAFHQFFTSDTIAWFAERGVKLKTEADGRMFPVTDSSTTIIDCLLEEARKFGIQIRLHTDVRSLVRRDESWTLTLSDGTAETADRICVACGGFPKTDSFDWLRDVGHSVAVPVPSLFTFNMPHDNIISLMGVSTNARVRISGVKYEEEGSVLITHWGLSGPAVLKLSARAARELAESAYHFAVEVNWCPGQNPSAVYQRFQEARTEHGRRKIISRNDLGLPQRLWEHLCQRAGVEEHWNWADLPVAAGRRLGEAVCRCVLEVRGKTTYREEFVTAGGITLSGVNPQTMESRVAPGLFFAGEVLDIDGVTGGFNFQNAWTTGWIAGRNLGDFHIFAPPN